MSSTKIIAVPDLEKTLQEYEKLQRWVSIFASVLLIGVAGAMLTITWESLGVLSLVTLLPIPIALFVILRRFKRAGISESLKIWQTQGQKGREFIFTTDEIQIAPIFILNLQHQDSFFKNGYFCLPWNLITDCRFIAGSKNVPSSFIIDLSSNNRSIYLNRQLFINVEAQVMTEIRQKIVGLNPELAQANEKKSQENLVFARVVAFTSTVGGMTIFFSVTLFLFKEFISPLNTAFLFLLFSAPLAFILYKFFGKKLLRATAKTAKTQFASLFFFFFFPLAFLAVTLISGIPNGEVTQELTITNKYYTRGSKGSYHFYASVPLTLDQARSLTHSSGTADIAISRNEYAAITPNTSKINLKIGYGALRTPFVLEKSFSNLSVSTASAAGSDPNHQKRLEAARSWVAEPVRTPANAEFREVRWPNGALKEKVPHVNGQAHGVGHYWYDNGTPYGQIPWKNGQKHGRFSLHRADGTLEQELSYQEGQPHGWLRWYDTSGKLKQEQTYEAGKVID